MPRMKIKSVRLKQEEARQRMRVRREQETSEQKEGRLSAMRRRWAAETRRTETSEAKDNSQSGQSEGAATPADAKDSHLLCPACDVYFKSHSSHLAHVAGAHPDRVDDLPVGRLGNAVFYQPTAKLFHCHVCFFTGTAYPQMFDHLLANHCFAEKVEEKEGGGGEAEEGEKPEEGKDGETEESKAGGGGGGGGQDEEEKPPGSSNVGKRKRSATAESKEEDNEDVDDDSKPPGGGAGSGAAAADPTHEAKEKAVLTEYTLFSGNRYVCRLCGWKTKMRGFIMSHIGRTHDEVPKPFACTHCGRAYILASQLLSHVALWHKQGLYRCPFCFFSSDLLRGMRRHCNRCSVRLDDGEGSDGAGVTEETDRRTERQTDTGGE